MHTLRADLAAFTDYLSLQVNPKTRRPMAQTTIEDYRRRMDKFHEWALGEGLSTTSMRAASGYIAEVRRRSVSAAYVDSRAIKAWGRWWAVDSGEADPFADLKYATEPDVKPQRTATAEDVKKLLASIDDDMIGLRDQALIHVMASTGMRRSEVSRMRWDELDLATGTVHITKTKNGHPRTARLSQEARRAVRRYMRALDSWEADQQRFEVEWVWASMRRRDQPFSSNGIGQMIQQRAKSAGVNVTAHSFRRGFAMQWLRAGGSETYLRQVAGWSDTRMVARYVSAVAQEEALAQHERIFG